MPRLTLAGMICGTGARDLQCAPLPELLLHMEYMVNPFRPGAFVNLASRVGEKTIARRVLYARSARHSHCLTACIGGRHEPSDLRAGAGAHSRNRRAGGPASVTSGHD